MKVVGYCGCLVYIFLCFTHQAIGQNRNFFKDDDKRFYGGLMAGINVSAIDGDAYSGYHKVGINAGGVVYGRLSQRFATSVSLLYTRKGTTGVSVLESQYVGTFIEKYYLKLNYAELPIVVHYIRHPKLHVGVGAAYGRLLSSKEELLSDQPVYINPELYYFNKEEYSAVLHAGYQLGKHLFFDVRYQYSLNSIRDYNRVHIRVWDRLNDQGNKLFSFRLMYLIK